MKNSCSVTVVLILILLSALTLLQNPAEARSNQPRIGEISGKSIYGSAGPMESAYVTGNVSGNTQFASSYFAGFGWTDDYFNTGWKVYVQKATNISVGTLVDVTDFESSSGTFTTADAGAAWATGDRVQLLFGVMGTSLEGSNQLSYSGAISSVTGIATALDSFYVEDFIGLPDDLFNEKFYVEYTLDATPTTAPQSEIVDIIDFVGSTGLVICGDATFTGFSATAVVGDKVTVLHETIAAPRLPGRLEYSGVAILGTIEDAEDSVYVAELKGFGNDYFNECNYWLHVVKTTDGAAPLGEYIPVLDYVSATGLFTVGSASNEYGFTDELDAGDVVAAVSEFIVSSSRGNNSTGRQVTISDNSASTTLNFYVDELIGIADSAMVGDYIVIQQDAGGAGAAPQGERRKIAKIDGDTGLITVDAVFSAAPAGGDIARIYPGRVEDLIWGAGGVQSVTAAKLAAGVSIAEGNLYDSDILDTLNTVKIEYLEDMLETNVGVLGIPEADTIMVTTVDGSATPWTQAAHRLATITEGVLVKCFAICTESLVGAGTLEIGVSDDTNIVMGQLADATTCDINEIWTDTVAQTGVTFESDWVAIYGTDIDLTVGTANITDGVLDIYFVYIPITSAGAIAVAVWD